MATAKYIELAQTLPREEFVADHAGHFLVKRPKSRAEAEDKSAGFGFQTADAAIDIDPWATEWQVLPVTKRPGNPFPERITVGRATNCDIVLRIPSVSKVHAHIVHEAGGTFRLHDNRASNGTALNSEKLDAAESKVVKIGDFIRFGSVEFQFVDAARLHDIATSESR